MLCFLNINKTLTLFYPILLIISEFQKWLIIVKADSVFTVLISLNNLYPQVFLH